MIARHMATACLIYLSLVLQSSVAAILVLYGFKPWFPGIALAACVLLHNGSTSVVWAALLGLAVDGLSAERLGLHAIMVTFSAMALLIARQEIQSMETTLTGLFVLAATFAWRGLSAIALGLLNNQSMAWYGLLISEFGSGVYTASIAMGLLGLVDLTKRGMRRRRDSTLPVLTNQWSMLTK